LRGLRHVLVVGMGGIGALFEHLFTDAKNWLTTRSPDVKKLKTKD